MEALLQQYGYLVLALGTFLEGETIAVLAGFLAFRGTLSFVPVVLVAFAGTAVGDQLFFYLGRTRGHAWIERRPHLLTRAKTIENKIRQHETAVILGFRFIYGMRTITPILLGASGTPWRKFTGLNLLSAGAWSLAVVSIGYFFGAAAESLIGHIKSYEMYVAIGIALVGLVLWVARHLRKHPR